MIYGVIGGNDMWCDGRYWYVIYGVMGGNDTQYVMWWEELIYDMWNEGRLDQSYTCAICFAHIYVVIAKQTWVNKWNFVIMSIIICLMMYIW